jgi:hypothetical protein
MGSELIVHSGDFEVNRTGFKGTAKGQKKQPMDGFLGGIELPRLEARPICK